MRINYNLGDKQFCYKIICIIYAFYQFKINNRNNNFILPIYIYIIFHYFFFQSLIMIYLL